MSDVGFSIAQSVLPFVRVAGAPFKLGFELAQTGEDGVVGPLDVTGVTDARVTLQLRVGRGQTPPDATAYTISDDGGAQLGTTTVDGVDYPILVVAEPAGLPAGVYDLVVTLTNYGDGDPLMVGTLMLIEQP